MKKEQILEAAYMLFINKGYKNVTMDEVAKEALVTKRTVYAYFDSKESLLGELFKIELKKMEQLILKIEQEPLSFINKLDKLLKQLLIFRKESKFIKALSINKYDLENGVITNNLQLIDKQIYDFILEKVNGAQAKKIIKNYDSEIIAYLLQKIYFASFDENILFDEAVISNNIIKLFKEGLLTGDKK